MGKLGLGIRRAAIALAAALVAASPAHAQADQIQRLDMTVGRSVPITTPSLISRVSIAAPDVADVVVIGNRELVINAKQSGETDAIVWMESGAREHYRVEVHSASDRMQIALYVKFAEVRRDALTQLGISGLYRDSHTRAGTGLFKNDNVFDPATGAIVLPTQGQFLSILTDLNTSHLLAFLQSEEDLGNARLLAAPNIMAANKEPATFLAGGELPIPVISSTAGSSTPQVSIQYKEYGIRLNFTGEVLSDSLLKLQVQPEVSRLDYANALEISGFKIPALSTRRVTSTVDVRRNESLIISGLFDDERQQTRSGIPLLMKIPILGQLFSSTQWQRDETELLVIVTPIVFDPMHPRPEDVVQMQPDTTLPAREAIQSRLAAPPTVQTEKGPTPR
jgi:pilus assembly protein CpaC